MKRKIINFFATKSDIELIFQLVETQGSIKYIECGYFSEPILNVFSSWKEIPNTGYSTAGRIQFEPCYLVTYSNTKIAIRRVAQRMGEQRYSIDQAENPETIAFRHGGLHEKTGSLIAGQIGTISENHLSKKLFGRCSGIIKKQFTHIKSYFVGNEAEQLLETGVRLTSDITFPGLYDLRRESL